MFEAATVYGIGAERIERGPAVFNKAGILFGVYAEGYQRNDDLCAALAVFAPAADKAAVFCLHIRQDFKSLVHCGLYAFIAGVIRCKRLNSYGGHVRIGLGAGICPTAGGERLVKYRVNERFARGGAALGDSVSAAVKRKQRVHGAVKPLPGDIAQLGKSNKQVMPRYVVNIASNGGQRKDTAGVFGG